MANERYGLKEVADVVFFDSQTGLPELFFDTLKVSTIENESESTSADGGKGAPKRVIWDYGRKATLQMQDALLSDQSISMLAGNEAETEKVEAFKKEVLIVEGGKVTLEETPTDAGVNAFKYIKGVMQDAIEDVTVEGKELTFESAKDGDSVMVFYTYIVPEGKGKLVRFTADKFPKTYKVIGDTVVRGEDGVDRVMQFHIPRAKLQTNFSLTMDAENVSVFDFNLEVIATNDEKGRPVLYKFIRIDG